MATPAIGFDAKPSGSLYLAPSRSLNVVAVVLANPSVELMVTAPALNTGASLVGVISTLISAVAASATPLPWEFEVAPLPSLNVTSMVLLVADW